MPNKWSQEDLAKKINTSRIMIGNYERNDNTPSIDVIIKICRIFDISVDFLLGEGCNANFDKDTIGRLDEMEKLPDNEKQKIFNKINHPASYIHFHVLLENKKFAFTILTIELHCLLDNARHISSYDRDLNEKWVSRFFKYIL